MSLRVQCEKSVEFILFVDGIGAVGYAALGHEATTAGRSVSFHAMTTVHSGTFDVHIRCAAESNASRCRAPLATLSLPTHRVAMPSHTSVGLGSLLL